MADAPSPANDPKLIYATYAIAFIPLTIIYALDFISDKWRTIRETRRNGVFLLLVSLPSLGCIIAYIVLQIKHKDHKEAAAAITVACFNMFHIARTIWGLIQLYEFRNWNVYALRCLLQLGYHAPVYDYSKDVKDLISAVRRLSPWASPPAPSTSYYFSSEDDAVDDSQFCSKLKSLCSWITGKMEKKRDELGAPQPMSLDSIKRTVDHHMIVNNSLIDNEFSENELPVRTTFFSRVSYKEPERHSAMPRLLSSFLKSPRPEESSVRWLVAFLAKFGSRWLVDTGRLHLNDAGSKLLISKTKFETARDLAALASLHTTNGSVGVAGSTEGFQSYLSPLSLFYLEPYVCRSSVVTISERCMLPFRMKGFKFQYLNFAQHEATIRNASKDDWHKASLNELEEPERKAVENINGVQLACFTALMEEDLKLSPKEEWDPSEIVESGKWVANWEKEDPRIENLMYQLGYDDSKDYTEFFAEMPIRKEFLGTMLWNHNPNRLLFQMSVHIDNFLALEAGNNLHVHISEGNTNCQPASSERNLSVFQKQYEIEIRRLRSRLLIKDPSSLPETSPRFQLSCESLRFIGSVAETVRSTLADWADMNEGDAGGWKPAFGLIGVRFKCSKQLCSAVTGSNNAGELDTLRSLQMRLIWELQSHVHWNLGKESAREGQDIRESPLLILLFILGFPALRLEKREHEGFSVITESGDHTVGLQDEYTLRPIGGPQDVLLLIKFDENAQTVSVEVQAAEQFFIWSNWKDAFMGRMSAQKDWRTSRLLAKREYLRDEACRSMISSPIETVSKEDLGTDFDFQYWSGWPPCMPQIAVFEMKKLCNFFNEEKDFDAYLVAGPSLLTDHISDLNAAMDLHFQSNMSSTKLYEKGCLALNDRREEEAMKLFGRCVSKHGHRDALEAAVKMLLEKEPISLAQEQALRLQMDYWFHAVMNRRLTGCTQSLAGVVDLDMLAHYFGHIYESSGNCNAMLQKALVLFHKSGPDKPVSEAAIQSIESYLLCEPFTPYFFNFKFHLAIAHQSRFQASQDPYEQELAAGYILELGTNPETIGNPFGISVGYLLEKGFYDGRDAQRKQPLLLYFSTNDYWDRSRILPLMFDRLFVRKSELEDPASPSVSAFGIGKRPRDAIAVYKNMTSDDNEDDRTCFSEALNRLGILYHRGAEGIPPSLSEAEGHYTKAIELQNNDSICNMGVLKNGNNAEGTDVSHLRRSVEENNSSGMNNLAIAYELGNGVDRDLCEAEKLYERSIELDKNPIAKYNLAMLYLSADDMIRNCEKYSDAKRMIDELSRPETELAPLYLTKAQIVKVSKLCNLPMGSASKWGVGLEEIDNCLAYVKLVEDVVTGSEHI